MWWCQTWHSFFSGRLWTWVEDLKSDCLHANSAWNWILIVCFELVFRICIHLVFSRSLIKIKAMKWSLLFWNTVLGCVLVLIHEKTCVDPGNLLFLLFRWSLFIKGKNVKKDIFWNISQNYDDSQRRASIKYEHLPVPNWPLVNNLVIWGEETITACCSPSQYTQWTKETGDNLSSFKSSKSELFGPVCKVRPFLWQVMSQSCLV